MRNRSRWVLLSALLFLSLRWWTIRDLRAVLLAEAVPQIALAVVFAVLATWLTSSHPRSASRLGAWVVAPTVAVVMLLAWAYLNRGSATTIDWMPALLRALFTGLLQWTFIQVLPDWFTVPTRSPGQAVAIGAAFLALTAPVAFMLAALIVAPLTGEGF